jgi:hypothetical protein
MRVSKLQVKLEVTGDIMRRKDVKLQEVRVERFISTDD